VHYHTYYKEEWGYERGCCPVFESAYERLLSLPVSAVMTDEDIRDVITAVNKVTTYYAK